MVKDQYLQFQALYNRKSKKTGKNNNIFGKSKMIQQSSLGPWEAPGVPWEAHGEIFEKKKTWIFSNISYFFPNFPGFSTTTITATSTTTTTTTATATATATTTTLYCYYYSFYQVPFFCTILRPSPQLVWPLRHLRRTRLGRSTRRRLE